MKAALVLLASAAGTLVLGGCASPPPAKADRSYVVLLDNGDGTTGQVQLVGAKGTTVLDVAGTATMIAGAPGNRFQVDEPTLKADFADAVAASPRRPVTYRLYFDFGGARLTSLSRAELPRILEEIGKRPAPDISVVGHTDTAGDAPSNVVLGMSRANSVAELLSSGGRLAPDRVSIESHGERNLLVITPDNTEEARNRRVEVTVR